MIKNNKNIFIQLFVYCSTYEPIENLLNLAKKNKKYMIKNTKRNIHSKYKKCIDSFVTQKHNRIPNSKLENIKSQINFDFKSFLKSFKVYLL